MAKIRNLNTPYEFKKLSLKNRVVMAPMCQYSAQEGMPNDWHYVHYVSRAVGGVGLIIVEMTNVAANGRISPMCLGLWNDAQRDAFRSIVEGVHKHGAKIAVQIAHAGRKAVGCQNVVSSSALVYDGVPEIGDGKWSYQVPHALTIDEIEDTIKAFGQSARRAVEAGFDAIELHGAHGYLIHQFYSPKMNQRDDAYGKDKMLFGVQVIEATKAAMPADMPLIMRISAQEYGVDGFDVHYGCSLAKRFAAAGVDILHVSGGGDGKLDPAHTPEFHAGYQVYLARALKQATGLPVIAVGMLEDPELADYVLSSGDCDLVALGRGLLRDPYWVLNAQYNLRAVDASPMQFVPQPYKLAF